MGIAYEDLIKEAEGCLTQISFHVDAQVRLNHQDALVGCEPFFCELLKRVYGWDLKNDNLDGGKQQDSFDLSDEDSRIAVQVTYTTTPAKIRKTLRTFVGKHDADFDRLIFAYPCNRASSSRASFDKDRGTFDFDAKRDRLDFGSILLKARSLSLDRLTELVRFVHKCVPRILETPIAHEGGGGKSALVKSSRSLRSSDGVVLYGRDELLRKLTDGDRDCLLVGQPGVGKTALLSAVVASREGYFVRGGSESALIAELNLTRPELVAIEDAHLRPDLIEMLRFIRHQHALSFRIIADCWPAHRDSVRSWMQLTLASVTDVQPIANKLIIEMAKDAGIGGPQRFFHHLVRQAMGYPGCAAMLLRCCQEGDQNDIREFFTGESMANWTRQLVERESGKEAMDVLSCLALGRDHGIPLPSIAAYLGTSLASVERIVTDFAVGGIVEQTDWGCLIVCPAAIRPVLVRDFFFGAVRRDLKHFLSDWRFRSLAAISATDAYCVGARIDRQELLHLARTSESDEAWDRLAAAEDVLADMVLDERPELLDRFTHTFIDQTPQRTIELLIDRKPKLRTCIDRQPDSKDQTVESWVKSGYPGKQAIPRRRIVLNAIADCLSAGVPAEQAYRFLECVLSPEYRSTGQSPEDFDTFVITSGLLLPADLEQLREFWPEILDLLKRWPPSDWRTVVDAIRGWIWPHCGGKTDDEQREQLRLAADEVLSPMLALCKDSPATVTELLRFGDYFDMKLAARVPAEYAALFPSEPIRFRTSESHREFERRSYQGAVELGLRWAKSDPSNTLQRLKAYGEDAQRLEHYYPDYRDVVCKIIARETDSRDVWIGEIMRQQLPTVVIAPFLLRSAEQQDERFPDQIKLCLDGEEYRAAAITVLLADIDDLPAHLVTEAIKASGPYSNMLYVAALRDEIAMENYLPLLNHADAGVRGHVAVGIWGKEKKLPTDPNLLERWRKCIAMDCPRDHAIAEIFEFDQAVCRLWIEHLSHAMSPLRSRHFDEFPVAVACAGFSIDERCEFLSRLSPESPYREQLVEHLVGESEIVFRSLLEA